jgi:hypothetical protein
MPWIRHGDGLKLDGDYHFDVAQVQGLIDDLRQARNQPGTVCGILTDLLTNGTSPKELVWRLSKWCHWQDSSERVARSIAHLLFHGNICRRLRDQANRPIPDRAIAEADYEEWLDRVVRAGHGLPSKPVFPDEVDLTETYREGAVSRVLVNAYERNPEARAKCLAYYGTTCFICGFDFGQAYDGVGQGYIHVHHLFEISRMGSGHAVDPITDMRPVCPNCHVVIHLYRQPFSIEEVKAMVARSRERP